MIKISTKNSSLQFLSISAAEKAHSETSNSVSGDNKVEFVYDVPSRMRRGEGKLIDIRNVDYFKVLFSPYTSIPVQLCPLALFSRCCCVVYHLLMVTVLFFCFNVAFSRIPFEKWSWWKKWIGWRWGVAGGGDYAPEARFDEVKLVGSSFKLPFNDAQKFTCFAFAHPKEKSINEMGTNVFSSFFPPMVQNYMNNNINSRSEKGKNQLKGKHSSLVFIPFFLLLFSAIRVFVLHRFLLASWMGLFFFLSRSPTHVKRTQKSFVGSLKSRRG